MEAERPVYAVDGSTMVFMSSTLWIPVVRSFGFVPLGLDIDFSNREESPDRGLLCGGGASSRRDGVFEKARFNGSLSDG